METNGIILLLFSLGGVHGILLSFLLKAKYKSDQAAYLSIISFLFGSLLVYYVAFWAGVQIPIYLRWLQFTTFLIGPLFYHLACGFPFRKTLSRPAVLHYLAFPLAIAVLYLVRLPGILLISQSLSLLAYAVATYFVLSSKPTVQKTWLMIPLAVYALLFCLYAALVYFQTLTLAFDYAIAACSGVFVYALLIKSYLHPQFLHRLEGDDKVSPLTSQAILKKVESFFTTHKPYLNGEYRLNDLSSDLAIKPYQLSEIINTKYDGFNQLVNDYRVKEAIELLNSTNEKVIDVAFMSGFNNKVSFYKAFKKVTGKTPANWKNNQ